MAIKHILRMGDPRLQESSEAVSEFNTSELDELIVDLFDTMKANSGAGLAAPQIGVLKRVVIFGAESVTVESANPRYPDAQPVPLTILINPQIEVLSSTQQTYWEGCLSIPGMRGLVARPDHIRYRGFDPKGQLIEREVRGFHAVVMQHEYDHLDGILYPMRMQDMSKFGFVDELNQAHTQSDQLTLTE
jgi:peptide deformylase